MPKHIKALKCPSVVARRATLIREDHYRCDSCSTEFFLDSDDITIHHKIETEPFHKSAATARLKRLPLAILAGDGLLLTHYHRAYYPGKLREGSSGMGSGEAGMSYSIEELATFTTTAGRPIVVILVSARPTSSTQCR